jgi:hypothetical protein
MPHASRLRHCNSEHTCFGQGRAWINSIRCPATNFHPFPETHACRNFQTTTAKPSFYFRFITIMNVFLDIIMV